MTAQLRPPSDNPIARTAKEKGENGKPGKGIFLPPGQRQTRVFFPFSSFPVSSSSQLSVLLPSKSNVTRHQELYQNGSRQDLQDEPDGLKFGSTAPILSILLILSKTQGFDRGA
ncbi:MAG: hypothetical protein R6V58_08720 [Planctomycetota bacterium]